MQDGNGVVDALALLSSLLSYIFYWEVVEIISMQGAQLFSNKNLSG